MSSRIQELRERRRKIYEEAHEVLTESEKDNRDLGAEELESFESRMAEVDRLGREIEAHEKEAEVRSKLEQPQTEPKIGRPSEPNPNPGVTPYEVAFRSYLRGGLSSLDSVQRRALFERAVPANELRAQGVATGGAGGFLVPEEFLRKITETLKFFGGVRPVANVISTDSGADMPWPSNDDTANVGAILAENTAITEQDLVFTSKTLKAFMYTSKLVRVSFQLLQDSAFNVEDYLSRKLGERIGRVQNTHFTTGAGTTEPQGFVTAGTVGVTLGVGNTTTLTYDGLVDLVHSVDPAYRTSGRARFMMSDGALKAARKVKDTTGQPIWQMSLREGVPDTLLGFSVTINNDMAAPAANAKSTAFGDFFAGYIVRDVRGIQMIRLDERFADFLQVGFFAFARTDGQADDTAAYRLLAHSAT